MIEFVKIWLLREGQWSSDRFHTIHVVFADESDSDQGSSDLPLLMNEELAQPEP